jgi:hypothetical protein
MKIMAAVALTTLIATSAFAAPAVTCHSGTISYKFVGAPGTAFTYGGKSYTVPKNGSIELVRENREAAYLIAGKSLPLEVWPMDAFGTRTVPLPRAEAAPATTMPAQQQQAPQTADAGGTK